MRVLEHSHIDDVPDGRFLGFVYCSGVAWGAESRAREAWDSHVISAVRWARSGRCDRFIYLSSTRVYDGCGSTHEDATLNVTPAGAAVYRRTKISGECIVLDSHPSAVVARLSNIYGENFRSGLFLADVLRQSAVSDHVRIYTSAASEKDYLHVEDAGRVIVELLQLPLVPQIVNIARGENTRNSEIIAALERLGVRVDIDEGATVAISQKIEIGRLQRLISWDPRSVIADMPELLYRFRSGLVGEGRADVVE